MKTTAALLLTLTGIVGCHAQSTNGIANQGVTVTAPNILGPGTISPSVLCTGTPASGNICDPITHVWTSPAGGVPGATTGLDILGVGTGANVLPKNMPNYFGALLGPNSGTPAYFIQLGATPPTGGGFYTLSAAVSTPFTPTNSDGSLGTPVNYPVYTLTSVAASGDVTIAANGLTQLVNINGSPIPAAALGANLPLLNVSNTFTGTNSAFLNKGRLQGTGGVSGTAATGGTLGTGTGGTCTVSGNDVSLKMTVVVGASATAGDVCKITWSTAYNTTPLVFTSVANALAASLANPDIYPSSFSTSTVTLTSTAALAAGTYIWNVLFTY